MVTICSPFIMSCQCDKSISAQILVGASTPPFFLLWMHPCLYFLYFGYPGGGLSY
jgi:hypothetical protein